MARQRDRRGEQRERRDDPDRRLASQLCGHAAGFTATLEAELFVSEILGSIWSERERVGLDADPEEAELEMGVSLINALAAHREPGARGLLAAFDALGVERLSSVASKRQLELGEKGVSMPEWATQIGRSKPVRAAVASEKVFDDGRSVWIESQYPDGDRFALGVMIDHNMYGIAKDIAPADSIDQVVQLYDKHQDEDESTVEQLTVEDVDPGEAAGRILEAITTTDLYLGTPVSDEYASFRALALQQVGEIGGDAAIEFAETPPVSPEAREQLLDDFLESAEASSASISEPDDGAEVVRLAIDFAADYGDGRPLRWSPIVVELFMADWLPRKIAFADEIEPAVPAALAAWIRFAGRRRGIPEAAIEITVGSIESWIEPMREAIEADDLNPATSLIRAAKEAGVDLGDKQALDAFLAGWNARSLEE